MTQPAASSAEESLRTGAAAANAQLVINLCSSTTPMSLVRPAFKELERFTFFVSRRREDGRERFRLHMGYFANRAEAEQLLAVVRTVYPGAWISDAPGKKLRGETPAVNAVPAPPAAANNGPRVDKPAAAKPAVERPAAPPAAKPVRQPPVAQPLSSTGVISMLDGVPPATDTSSTATLSGLAPVVTHVQAPSVPRPPVLQPPRGPAHKAASHTVPEAAPQTREPIADVGSLSDSQVMRVLERPPSSAAVDNTDVPMVNKLDTHSLQALRKDLSKNLPVPFAVQLIWSPVPVDVQDIPPLAIFRAYTLYTVGCMFEGRKWYGLRLGFFSDALSAKQVAQYVRSEFKSVAVVPVSNRERSQADATGGIDVDKTTPVRHGTNAAGEEITLLPEADKPQAPAPAVDKPAAAKPAAPTLQPSANKPKAAASSARVLPRGAARNGANRTLEETLEILGASQLSIDNGKGERINLTGRRSKDSAKTSTFSKLLDRLADRMRT